eukprot:1304502-Heterocapsa_arctica.AAC.1
MTWVQLSSCVWPLWLWVERVANACPPSPSLHLKEAVLPSKSGPRRAAPPTFGRWPRAQGSLNNYAGDYDTVFHVNVGKCLHAAHRLVVTT